MLMFLTLWIVTTLLILHVQCATDTNSCTGDVECGEETIPLCAEMDSFEFHNMEEKETCMIQLDIADQNPDTVGANRRCCASVPSWRQAGSAYLSSESRSGYCGDPQSISDERYEPFPHGGKQSCGHALVKVTRRAVWQVIKEMLYALGLFSAKDSTDAGLFRGADRCGCP